MKNKTIRAKLANLIRCITYTMILVYTSDLENGIQKHHGYFIAW